MCNRIELNHLNPEDRRAIGVPTVIWMRVTCDHKGCSAITDGYPADGENDDFTKERVRGDARRAGWKVGPYSTGHADFCPDHSV